jgi:hypothetical protein
MMPDPTPRNGDVPGAELMGELARGPARWEVYLEMAAEPELIALRGRIHFTQADRRRVSGWIFLERTERDIRQRFAGFSDVDLWNLLESVGP